MTRLGIAGVPICLALLGKETLIALIRTFYGLGFDVAGLAFRVENPADQGGLQGYGFH